MNTKTIKVGKKIWPIKTDQTRDDLMAGIVAKLLAKVKELEDENKKLKRCQKFMSASLTIAYSVLEDQRGALECERIDLEDEVDELESQFDRTVGYPAEIPSTRVVCSNTLTERTIS